MQFALVGELWQVLCPFADTAVPDPKTGQPSPTEACLVFVRTLPPADRQALADLLPDDWADRVRLIFAECVTDERGACPPPAVLESCFARFDLPTTEKVHRMCCAANGLDYLEYPTDERVAA
jgi:hypothetical protein